MDFWQRPVADLGLTGPDRARAASTSSSGPDGDPARFDKPGYFVRQSATNNIVFGVRILDKDPAYYETFKSTLKMGRVGQPLATCPFIENHDVEWSATAPRGLDYWRDPLGGGPGRTGARRGQGLDGDAAAVGYREGEDLRP